jgi:hypothetical protein
MEHLFLSEGLLCFFLSRRVVFLAVVVLLRSKGYSPPTEGKTKKE